MVVVVVHANPSCQFKRVGEREREMFSFAVCICSCTSSYHILTPVNKVKLGMGTPSLSLFLSCFHLYSLPHPHLYS